MGLQASFTSGSLSESLEGYADYHHSASVGPVARWRPLPESLGWLWLQGAARLGWRHEAFARQVRNALTR